MHAQNLDDTFHASYPEVAARAAAAVSTDALLVTQAEWPRAIEELCSFPHIEEAAVLSTCNRMELYVVALSWHRVSSQLPAAKGRNLPAKDSLRT